MFKEIGARVCAASSKYFRLQDHCTHCLCKSCAVSAVHRKAATALFDQFMRRSVNRGKNRFSCRHIALQLRRNRLTDNRIPRKRQQASVSQAVKRGHIGRRTSAVEHDVFRKPKLFRTAFRLSEH